jgi:nitroreductase
VENSPVAYRVVLIEAGHIGQNMVLAATACGLASVTTSALADSILEPMLKLTSITQAAVYAVILGVADPTNSPLTESPK